MKKLKMNMRYFIQLRQSPSMAPHLTTQRVGDLSEINPINNSRSKRRSAAPVWSTQVYSMEARICGLIPENLNHFPITEQGKIIIMIR